jgi:D-alanyl-D-alanine carboxypeptidase/D-alanyl-D-alanine-endopeptidase (penicillin-binding protein 4)
MRRFGLLAIVISTAAFVALAYAQPARWPAPLHAALAQAGVPRDAVALYVAEAGSERPLIAWNAERAMNPASSMKLVTTLAGLELLGPTFTWRTETYVHGTLVEDVLHGDLILRGQGDPKLNLENFWLLLRELRARGLREIRGDLLLDRSHFLNEDHDAGRFDNEPTRPYNVLPDALLLNYKSVRLQFLPQEDSGAVKILSVPELPQIEIVNQLVVGAGSCEAWPERPLSRTSPPRLVFSGVFPRGCGERSRSFALLSPNDYALALFRQTWAELGGSFSGGVREAQTPPDAVLFAAFESPPLSEVIRDINKFSNNVMARQLFLSLSLAVEPPPASTEKSIRAVREWLDASGLAVPELVLENGSGLSRSERISARSLARILEHGFAGPLMPEYLASLPIPGRDGTLRRRLETSPVAGRAHIKSGYLDGVRSIAGYVLDGRGRWLVVVAIINHPRAVNAQAFQDAVIDWVHAQANARSCCMR